MSIIREITDFSRRREKKQAKLTCFLSTLRDAQISHEFSCALLLVYNLLVLEDSSSALALWKIYLKVNRAWKCVGDTLLALLIPNKSCCAHSSPYQLVNIREAHKHASQPKTPHFSSGGRVAREAHHCVRQVRITSLVFWGTLANGCSSGSPGTGCWQRASKRSMKRKIFFLKSNADPQRLSSCACQGSVRIFCICSSKVDPRFTRRLASLFCFFHFSLLPMSLRSFYRSNDDEGWHASGDRQGAFELGQLPKVDSFRCARPNFHDFEKAHRALARGRRSQKCL